jgi:hypothetical protein
MLAKLSIALLLVTATAIAAYLFLVPGDEGFDAAGSQPQDATSSQPQDGICKHDEERLARLRANPSLDEGLRFVSEIRCLRLWPQLQTVMDGLSGNSRGAATPRANGSASDTTPTSDVASAPETTSATLDDACEHDEDRLAELRANPSVEAAVRFDNKLRCPRLQPQLPAILKQLSQTGTAEAANQQAPAADTMPTRAAAPPDSLPPASEVTSVTSDEACKRDEERLAELQAKPSMKEALRFQDEFSCSRLQPQIIALLESFSQAPQSAGTPASSEVLPNPTAAGETGSPASEPPTTTSATEAPGSSDNSPSAAAAGETAPAASAPPTSEAAPAREAQTPTEAPANTASVVEAAPPASNATSETSTDACKQDEGRLARLPTNPTSEEATRLAQELRCETLRPELLALTGELANPPPTQTSSVSNEARGARNAVNDAQPPAQAIADAERQIAALENDKEALAAEVSRLQRNQAPLSAEQPARPTSPQPAPLAEQSEPQSASQPTEDAERRIAALESEKEALAAEVSKLQQEREAPSAEQATPTPSPQPANLAERAEAEAASQAAADAERRVAELESEKVALTAEVSALQRDRQASSPEKAKAVPPPPSAAPAERSDAEPAAALASLPKGMLARVLIRYLTKNADARAQAEKLSSALTAQGVEVADLRESRTAIRTELSFSYAPDETIARQVGRVVGVAPLRRPQPKDGLMLRPGTVELNLSGDSHLAAAKTTSTRESNHE